MNEAVTTYIEVKKQLFLCRLAQPAAVGDVLHYSLIECGEETRKNPNGTTIPYQVFTVSLIFQTSEGPKPVIFLRGEWGY